MEELQKNIGYTFKNTGILKTALTHSSYANEMRCGESNERLEFLGDSVLSVVVSQYIFEHFKHKNEGEMTRLRAGVVCEPSLARYAAKIGLGRCLLMGHGEMMSRGYERASILSDAFEAVIAAIFLDGGMDEARKFILRFTVPDLSGAADRRGSDYKTRLQEIVQQSEGEVLEYVLVSESGPDHKKHFVFEVRLNSNILGRGGGRSKKEAEQNAAHEALRLLGEA